MAGTIFPLPKRLTQKGLDADAMLYLGNGAYVTVAYRGVEIELPEEGDGSPESLERVLAYARRNRRGYVLDRIERALEHGEMEGYYVSKTAAEAPNPEAAG